MYQTIKLIGRGANADVFLVKNVQDNSVQTIKKLMMRDTTEKERETIATQLQLLKKLKHVNIVTFRDSFIDSDGNLNIVMDYCQGGNMHDLIQETEGKKFQQKKIIDWIVQIALSIFYLHQRKILHRDIKTQNIFLTNGKVVLGDFGVSKVLDGATDLARTNIGTPYYMSPQQYRQKPYSYKSDIWAFGCVIYQMCNQRHVFEALSLNALAVKVMKGIYSPISHEYSRELRILVDEMLSQNSKNRPSIFQILTRPFLFGKVKNYIKTIYKNKDKYQSQVIQSLIQQAKSLRIVLQDVKPKINERGEGTPSGNKMAKVQNKYERNRQKLLKQQKQRKYEQLSQQLKKQIQQRNRAQQKLKQMVQKNKEIKKKLKPGYKFSFHKGNINDINNKSKNKLQQIYNNQSVQQKNKDNKDIKDIKQSKQKKILQPQTHFKIQQEFDMDYQEYSDDDGNQQKTGGDNKEQQEVKQQQKITQQKKSLRTSQQPKQQQSKVDKLQKQVKQKTIMITNIRIEMSQLDFKISSNSDQSDKQQKLYHQTYTRLNDKINDLKHKIIAQLGRNGYTQFFNYVQNNINKPDRNKVISIVGEGNIGVWQIAQNIVKLQKVISKIPMYA